MREILYRGKRVDNGEWVEGFYLVLPTGETVILSNKGYVKVIPETIGQYTGLCDKNGNKIFEGDILLKGFENVSVNWNSNQCRWGIYSDGYEICGFNESTQGYFEVIGSIHDNPELLEVETMNREEQIAEMAKIICGRVKDDICIIDRTSCDSCCNWARQAEKIYNAGYRRAEEVRKETAKEIMQEWADDNSSMGLDNTFVKNIAKKYGVEVEE